MQENLRRDFLTSSASGIGGIALSHLLSQESFAELIPIKALIFHQKQRIVFSYLWLVRHHN